MRLVVTGGLGFIGSNFIRAVLRDRSVRANVQGTVAVLEGARALGGWWRAVKDGTYRDFYRTWYEERVA